MISDLTKSQAPLRAHLSSSSADKLSEQTLICFSHLRWDFVFQRPQHLMTRFASMMRVVYWEEPVTRADVQAPMLELKTSQPDGVVVATPLVPEGLHGDELTARLRTLLDDFLRNTSSGSVVRWYYTPMMLPFSEHLNAVCTVYDCMDELANFRFAPPELHAREKQLIEAAAVVFTGGYSLYEAKKGRHPNIHPFPSSVDREHFAKARGEVVVPGDMARLSGPRLGFYGVVDERFDIDLLAAVADARPDYQFVIVGPVVKIDPAELPQRANIHYVGQRSYAELPNYLAAWDVALMPFAINDSTKFISPTKTPEYLAGGKPVVSTPITDVVRHYGELDAVAIASTPEEFVAACDQAVAYAKEGGSWLRDADAVLNALSWDRTFADMAAHIAAAIKPAPAKADNVANIAARRAAKATEYDYLIVGAGFAGSVLAERLATQLNKRVLLIDKRNHIAGNAYDEKDAGGVLMHKYGPHIFHTNSAEIFTHLSQFTRWRPYEHRVLARFGDLHVPMPINRTTLNKLYGLNLRTDADAEAFLASRAEPVENIRTSEDVVVSKIGRELYEQFFRGYTRKQWGLDPSQLDKSVTARVPTRTNDDDRYFTDRYQAMPLDGYTRMFENMLDDERITVETGVDFDDVDGFALYDRLIYTGPIDEFFGHRFGKLPYRSLRFEHVTLDREWYQPVGTVNFPTEDVPYTRVSEYKHITGQKHSRTTITYEYPEAEGDPYYPVPRAENQALYKKYEALAAAMPDVIFAGRLATYRYYNMDQVVGQALSIFKRIAEQERRAPAIASSSLTALEA